MVKTENCIFDTDCMPFGYGLSSNSATTNFHVFTLKSYESNFELRGRETALPGGINFLDLYLTEVKKSVSNTAILDGLPKHRAMLHTIYCYVGNEFFPR